MYFPFSILTSENTYFHGLAQLFIHLFRKEEESGCPLYVIKHVLSQERKGWHQDREETLRTLRKEAEITLVKHYRKKAYNMSVPRRNKKSLHTSRWTGKQQY